jgi:elongation factor P
MGIIKAGQIEKGIFLLVKGAPHQVVERDFVNPGKGSAFSRLKLKNVRNGLVLQETYKTQDNCEQVEVVDQDSQYMYNDGSSFHFMDAQTYDQFEVPMEAFESQAPYLREGDTYRLVVWEGEYLDIKLPPKMIFEVVEAPEAVKGNTVQGASKMVTTETGLEVKVPIFIKQGEKILVNTDTGEYVERVNK